MPEVTHKDLQQAARDINTVFELSPQIKIINARPNLEKAIKDNMTIFASDSRRDQLEESTIVTYDSLVTAQSPAGQPAPVEAEAEVETVAAGEGEEECPVFGKEFDPSAPECNECTRAAECAPLTTTVAEKPKKPPKEKKQPPEPGQVDWKEGSTARAILDIIRTAGDTGITKEEATAKFEAMVAAGEAKSSNPAGRVATIFSGVVRLGLATKEGKVFKAI